MSASSLDSADSPRQKKVETPCPPGTYKEFLSYKKLSDWPIFDEREAALELDQERNLLGTQEEIADALREHAPMPMYMLEDLEDKLFLLQRRLDVYASEIVVEHDKSHRLENNLFHSPSEGPLFIYKKVMEKATQSNAVKAHRRQRKDKNKELRTLILGSKARSVETMTFPGFNKKELTDLPHGLEAPQILNRVTKAQDFNSGFSKFWKKLFLSEASVAVMQDTFWWLFVVLYEPKRKDDEHRLFNRIADSFVALFMSVNPSIKDKFFTEYSDCLAQALFAAYWEAFTDSHHKFDDDFKQQIASLCSEWIAGVKAPPKAWSHWDTKKLQPRSMSKEKETDKKKVVLMKEGKVNKDADFSISIYPPVEDDVQLPEGALASSMAREATTMTTKSLRFMPTTTTIPPAGGATPRMPTAPSQPAQIESHQIGPGPEFERVLFNIQGRSPLVAHYLHMKGLATNDRWGRTVRRTEVSKLQEPAPTYREVIKETQKLSKDLNSEYKKISEELAKEMQAIEKQKLSQSREIEKIKHQIMHHNVDMKILSEKILDMRGREGLLAFLRQSTGDFQEREYFMKKSMASDSDEGYTDESSGGEEEEDT
ncbi:protein FAM227A-like [Amphiura filiformis]|uniref:protein FAM227A-like n=1 Tax=Amphiura filiformis TaxID=82378 RepID=UPI003B228044